MHSQHDDDRNDRLQSKPGIPNATVEGAPPALPLSQAARGALIVLDTLAMTGPLARRTLAHVLRGEPSARASRYTRIRHFGKFIALKVREIDGLLQQLVALGLLEECPVPGTFASATAVKLTPEGQAAVRVRAPIPVILRTVTPEEVAMARAEQEAGSSPLLTFRLLEEGRSPDEIAAVRGLTVNTIYGHFAALIEEGQLELDAVIPRLWQDLIRDAMARSGPDAPLARIKELLPPEVGYGAIRCVDVAFNRGDSGRL